MIAVEIIESGVLTARCVIGGGPDEFRGDLARIKSIPFSDRDYVDEDGRKYWLIRHAEKYVDLVPEIGKALEIHRRQLRFF